jgi:hypothetical protein
MATCFFSQHNGDEFFTLDARDGDEFFTLGARDGDGAIFNLSTRRGDSISAQRVKLQEKGKEMQLSSEIATTMAQFQNRKYLRSDTIRVSLVCIVTIPAIHSASDTQLRSVPFFL